MLLELILMFADADTANAVTDASISGWLSALGTTGLSGALLIWLITKGFPALLERHDKSLETMTTAHTASLVDARLHFERILTNIDTSRSVSAKEGHDAAKQLAGAIDKSNEAVRENTRAVDSLSQKISTRPV